LSKQTAEREHTQSLDIPKILGHILQPAL